MGIAEVVLRYVSETVKFSLANEIFCGKQQKYRMMLIGLAINLALWSVLSEGEYRFVLRLLSYGLTLGFMYASVAGTMIEKADVLLRSWMVSVVCEGVAEIVSGGLKKERIELYDQAFREYVIQSLFVILVLCLIFLLKEILGEERKQRLLQLFRTYAAIGIGAVIAIVLALLGLLGLLAEGVRDDTGRMMLAIVREGGAVGAGLLGLLFLSVKSANDRLEQIHWQQTRYLAQQQEYYELLLEKEADTRKYRHDMKRHLMNLYALQKEGKQERVRDYLADMAGALDHIQKQVYTTGNDVIDILSNVYLARLKEEVEVTFDHRLSFPVKISDMDLCTVCGNLMENAVEELCRSKEKGFLHLEVNCGQFWFSFSLENSAAEYSNVTRKKDKKNHGLGLQNVKRTVERLEGTYEVKARDGVYSVTVILPNIEPDVHA